VCDYYLYSSSPPPYEKLLLVVVVVVFRRGGGYETHTQHSPQRTHTHTWARALFLAPLWSLQTYFLQKRWWSPTESSRRSRACRPKSMRACTNRPTRTTCMSTRPTLNRRSSWIVDQRHGSSRVPLCVCVCVCVCVCFRVCLCVVCACGVCVFFVSVCAVMSKNGYL